MGLLALAIAGLAVDRLLLGGEVSGPASASASNARSAEPSHAQPPAPEAPETVAAMIALRLDSMRGNVASVGGLGDVAGTQTRDAFAPIFRASLVEVKEVTEPEPTTVEGASAEQAAKDFQKSHRLQAVLVPRDGGEPRAMVDGKSLVIGEEFNKARLVEIRDESVIFDVQGVRVELALRRGQIGASR